MASLSVIPVGPFFDALCGLLDPPQLAELPTLAAIHPNSRELARELMTRKWLTAFQANLLLQGKGRSLVVGPYVLLERVGVGGMGEVYKARHRKLHRLAAVKVISPDKIGNAVVHERFLREAEAAAQLSHPNIVAVFDAGAEAGSLFLAMEYIDGIDLGRLVSKAGPLPVALACAFMRQAALGLHHAHSLRFVHRDIKPQNLLASPRGGLTKSGTAFSRLAGAVVKLLDMGLVRLQPERVEQTHLALTQHGIVIGTLDYIAPEQARNSHRIDSRADLYALGCTFYHLLAGEPPFPGGSAMDKLLRHQAEIAPPLRPRRPDVPAALERAIARLMAKRPEDRHPDALGLVKDLDAIEAGASAEIPTIEGPSSLASPEAAALAPTVAMPRPGRSPLLRAWWLAGAVAAGLLLAVCCLALFRGKPSEPSVRPPDRKTPREEPATPKPPADMTHFLLPDCGAVMGFQPGPLLGATILRSPGRPSPLPMDPGLTRVLKAMGVDLPADADHARFFYRSTAPLESTWMLQGRFQPAGKALEPQPKSRHPMLLCRLTDAEAVHVGHHGPNLFVSASQENVERCMDCSHGVKFPHPDHDLWEAYSRADRKMTLWLAMAPRKFEKPKFEGFDAGLQGALKSVFVEARVVSGQANIGGTFHAEFTLVCHDEPAAIRLMKALQWYQWLARWGEAGVPKSEYLKRLWVKAATSARIGRDRMAVTIRTDVLPGMLASK